MPAIHVSRRLVGPSLLAAILASGCATTRAPLAPNTTKETTSSAPAPEVSHFIPVVRHGRYTLVELAPTAVQRDLLLQVVDMVMPEEARATVGDGLRHVLQHSGYQLCETLDAVIELYSLPLPMAHQRLGPTTLRDALLTLAGPVWKMEVDAHARLICFVRSDDVSGGQHADIPPTEPAPIHPHSADGVLP